MCAVVCGWGMYGCVCVSRQRKQVRDMISSVREELQAIFALFLFFFLLINFYPRFSARVCNSFGNTASSVAVVFLKITVLCRIAQ